MRGVREPGAPCDTGVAACGGVRRRRVFLTRVGNWCFVVQAEDGIRDLTVTGVQTCALPIYAVANTRVLLGAARDAGVRKVVHISVSNPAADSELDYYAGKARAEQVVRESRLPWAIVRPTLVFGQGDILINNIAWLLRRLPIFGIPGRGDYRVQPVAAEDVAEIATWAAEQTDNVTVDAAGPRGD